MGYIRFRLAAVLADRGISKGELAERLGVAPSTITRLMHPQAIHLERLAELCEILDCQPGDLLVLEGGKHL